MPLRHLVVTPLPNGRSGNTGLLSVHLSPRLREDGELSDYPDFGDWGQFVVNAPAMQFQVLLDGVPAPPAAVTVVSPAVDPRLWQAVFGNPSKVPVKAFAFADRSNIDLASIDSGEISEQMMALVRAVAALGGAATKADIEAAAAGLRGLLADAQRHFAPIGNDADPAPPSYEFHDQLGLLGAHPYLLRLLGLVFDLSILLPGAVGEVAVRTNWPAKAGGLVGLRDQIPMRVAVDADFRAVVDQREFRVTDWLSLGGPKYAVAQLDLINASAQMAHFVDDLDAASSATSAVEVPALLETGLSIIHGDLGDVLRGRLERQREIEDGIDDFIRGRRNRTPLLAAEDITVGYRYDAEDQARPGFHSLHDRTAPNGYVFPRDKTLKVETPQDEGWGSIALFTDGSVVKRPQATNVSYPLEGSRDIDKVEERDNTAWRVDDHVMTWGGWSLSTPRVGKSSTGAGEVKPAEPNVPPPGSPTRLVVDYAHVNGTLPRLRYGRSYRVRARCVDLAGNGPQLADSAPPDGESPVVQFGRPAPLTAPLVVRRESRADPGVGDLADVLVIKSELHQPAATITPTARLLFPPRISQGRLERHDLPGGGNDPVAYAFLAERDARSLADQAIEDPETGELVAGAAVVDGQVTAGPTKPPIGYLPDPVAGGVAFVALPGGDPAVPLLMRYGPWPDEVALRLELKAGNGEPRAAHNAKRVTVKLPKGTVASAELSHAPTAALLSHMALAQGLASPSATLNGLNRSISGRRSVTFVHAVRVPLRAPSFGDDMTFSRADVGQTDVTIDGTLGMHRATSEHIVLRSRWVDTIDTPGTPAPVDQVNRRVIADLTIATSGESDTSEPLGGIRFDLGDTKRREVTVKAEAFCRFSRYFTERIELTTGDDDSLLLDARGVSPGSVVLSRTDTGESFRRDEHFSVDRVAGTLTILDTAAIPVGTTCRVEYIPLPVSRLSEEARVGKLFEFDLPASAPPADRRAGHRAGLRPQGHDHRRTDHRASRRPCGAPPPRATVVLERCRRAARVALDSTPATGAELTNWGRDPLADGTGATVRPGLDHFLEATERAVAVDGRFDVAAHEVVFDPERRSYVLSRLLLPVFRAGQ